MSNRERMNEALVRFDRALVKVSYIAQVLFMTESAMHGVRADVFDGLRDACAEMRDAQQAFESAKEALVVDMIGESLEGAGQGGMTS